MIDLKDKIKKILKTHKESGHFSVLKEESSELIQQIFETYEKSNDLKQDFENIPKNADLIFIAAPTGAGKDNLVHRFKLKEKEKNYIELNMDIFRHYFSEFALEGEVLRDKTFATQTNQFSYEMYVTIQELLLTEFPGTNIIITGTLRETDWVEETFRKYKENPYTNYKITIACLAVPKKESAISVIGRYVMLVDTGMKSEDFKPGTARYTDKAYHDETYDKFPENLRYFENIDYIIDENGNKRLKLNGERLIDVMEVYKRNKVISDYSEDTLVYSSLREYNENGTALEAVEKLRNMDVKFSNREMGKLLKRVIDNYSYFKSQGTVKEIAYDIAVLLDYKKVVNKLDKVNGEDFNR